MNDFVNTNTSLKSLKPYLSSSAEQSQILLSKKKVLPVVQDGCLRNVTEFSYMVKFCSCVQITVRHNVY